ncbi:MAG: hypothetical protein Q9M26_03610 [Mariprofundales bacterium]|nr:hypothetical protein [Mariprofundales bacterium]
MNIQRAQAIATRTSTTDLIVEAISGGLLVRHHGRSAFFVREACFWPFIYRLSCSQPH